ncbi:MAG TPA: insulinase family protein, partial [Gammaproteobacteria bacterium]|nr:insulinase family protein [Gammaproteobacteria bacterium]
EHDGITGVSHVLEHMMFKGTARHGPGEFSRIIAENGGEENAFTGRDYTAYFQQLEKSRLEVSFEMEADRMRNLLLPEEEFAREVKVVMEERRMRTEDRPESLTYEQLNAAAFVNSPYHHPIIGWMEDLESLEIADLAAWYRRWYAPNNATLVVVGDVDPRQVLKLARKHFGPIPTAGLKLPKPRTESRQRGVRRVGVRAPAELPYLLMGYKVPVLKTAAEEWEPYALEVLAGVLDGGDSARLARNLVRKRQLAASAGAGYNLYSMRQDLFLLDGTPARGHSAAELEEALREEIERLKRELVSDAELARIKAQVVAGKTYEQDSIFYQAMQMGTLETVGLGWQRMDEYSDRVLAITAEQLQKVARKYLVDERLTVARLEPLPLENGNGGKGQGGEQHEDR